MKQSPDKTSQRQGAAQRKGNTNSFFNSQGGAGSFFGPAVQRKAFIGSAPALVQAKAKKKEEGDTIQAKMIPGMPLIQQKSNDKQAIQAKKGQAVNTSQLDVRTVDHEFFAHKIAYDPTHIKKKPFSDITRKCGYDPNNAHLGVGQNAFMMTLVMPLPQYKGKLAPILAVRGTDMRAGGGGVSTDLDIKQVGNRQYWHNLESVIKPMLSLAGGSVVITGHSLGGAVAQMIAAKHTGNIAKLVTFQSPGVSLETIGEYKKNVKKQGRAPSVAHHVMEGDAVDKAGMGNIPGGSIYQHHFDDHRNAGKAHTSFVTHTDKFKGRREQLGMGDNVIANSFGKKVRSSRTGITKHDKYHRKGKRARNEIIRKVFGVLSATTRATEDILEHVGGKKGSVTKI